MEMLSWFRVKGKPELGSELGDRLLYLVTPGAGAWLSRKHIDFFTFVWIRILFGIIGLISYNIPERSRYRKRVIHKPYLERPKVERPCNPPESTAYAFQPDSRF